MFGPTCDRAVLDRQSGHAVEQRQVHVLPQRQHQRIGFQRLDLAGRLREALFIQFHLFDGERALVGHVLDRRQPFDQHAFLQCLLDLEVVRRHALARAAVDDDRTRWLPAASRCARRRARCCRRRRRRRAGPASACPRPPCCAAPTRRRACARPRPRECTRVWRCARRPRERLRRTALRASSRGCSSPCGSTPAATPMSRMRLTSASRMSRGSRYLGMPKRIMPPAIGPASTIVTRWPSRRR